MKQGFIYKITSPSGKIYIGQTTNLSNRKYRYKLKYCKSQLKLYNSLNKYDFSNHIFEVIENCEISLLREREIYWIKFYNSKNIGLNCTDGGEGFSGGIVSDETRKKMSEKKKGIPVLEATKEKIRASMMNKVVPEIVKQKISKSRMGIKFSDKTIKKLKEKRKIFLETGGIANKKKVYQYDLNYNLIKIWEYRNQAAKELNIKAPSISIACNKIGKKYKKFYWSWELIINFTLNKEHD